MKRYKTKWSLEKETSTDVIIMILYICLYCERQSGLTDDHNTNKSNISDSTKDVFCDDRCTDSLPDSGHTSDSDEKSLQAGMNIKHFCKNL